MSFALNQLVWQQHAVCVQLFYMVIVILPEVSLPEFFVSLYYFLWRLAVLVVQHFERDGFKVVSSSQAGVAHLRLIPENRNKVWHQETYL